MIDVIVDNRLRLDYKLLPKEVYKELKESLTYKNPNYYKARGMGYGTKGISQFITSYKIENKNEISITRGASYKLKEIARNNDIKLNFIDKRLEVPIKFSTDIILRDYQIKPFMQLKHFENALIQGVCGCGKTIILLKAIEEIGQKTLIIVHETKLQKQWVDHIKDFFKFSDDEIGLIGGISKGKNKVGKITVAMQQSLLKTAENYKDEFGCIVCDEVHRFAASTFQTTIDQFPARYRIGATATPKRKDGKQFLVFDQFGKIVHKITDDDLLELDMIHEVKMVVVPTEFKYDGKMDVSFKKVATGLDENGSPVYETERIERINHNDLLQKLIMDPERNRLIYEFIKAEVENNNYCILLSDRRRFCHNWQRWLEQKGIESKLLVGGTEHKLEGEEAIERIKEETLQVVIGTTVADEALDIPRLNRGFSATPTATNERRIVQQAGRIKRKCEGKDSSVWYYFCDVNVEGHLNHIKLLKKYFRNIEVLENKQEVEEYLYYLKGSNVSNLINHTKIL